MAPNQPVKPTEDPRSEINKLGTGQPVDHAKLHEQMNEDRLDRILESLKGEHPESHR